MNQVLLTAGVAAVFIAVVGGGAKAMGFEVPVLESGARQLALGIVGVIFIGAAIAFRDTESNGTGSDPSVDGYRQEVLATCRALPRGQPVPTSGTSFEREAFLNHLRAQRESWGSSLSDLWDQDVPGSLEDDKAKAEAATARFIERWGVALERLEGELPAQFGFPTAVSASQTSGTVVAAQARAWEAAMSRLAAAPCTPPAQ